MTEIKPEEKTMNEDIGFWEQYEPVRDAEWHSAFSQPDDWHTDMLVLAAKYLRQVAPKLAKQTSGLDNNLLGADIEAWLAEFES